MDESNVFSNAMYDVVLGDASGAYKWPKGFRLYHVVNQVTGIVEHEETFLPAAIEVAIRAKAQYDATMEAIAKAEADVVIN